MTTTILGLGALLAAAALAAGCPSASSSPANGPKPASAPSPSSDPGAQVLPQRGKVFVQSHDGREWPLAVEIASTPPERTRGLMFRKSLPEDAGMIFVFPEEAEQAFWMQNTLIPLDMAFVDARGQVLGIVANAEPLTTTPRSVPGLAKMVLEVNGGWCARHGVVAGDRVRLEGSYKVR